MSQIQFNRQTKKILLQRLGILLDLFNYYFPV